MRRRRLISIVGFGGAGIVAIAVFAFLLVPKPYGAVPTAEAHDDDWLTGTTIVGSDTVEWTCPDFIGFKNHHMHLSEYTPGTDHLGNKLPPYLEVPVIMGDSMDCGNVNFKVTAERLDPQNEPDILDDIVPLGAGATGNHTIRGGFTERRTSEHGSPISQQVEGTGVTGVNIQSRKEGGVHGTREGPEMFRLRLHSITQPGFPAANPTNNWRDYPDDDDRIQIKEGHDTMLVSIRDMTPKSPNVRGQLCPQFVGFEDDVIYIKEGDRGIKTNIITGFNRLCGDITAHYESIDGDYQATAARVQEGDYHPIRGAVKLKSGAYGILNPDNIGDVRKSINVNAIRDNKKNEGDEFYYVEITRLEQNLRNYDRGSFTPVRIDPLKKRLKVIVMHDNVGIHNEPAPNDVPKTAIFDFDPAIHSGAVTVPEGDKVPFRVRAFTDFCKIAKVHWSIVELRDEAHYHKDHKDFVHDTGVLTFAHVEGQNWQYQTVDVQTLADRLKEDDERFRVILWNPHSDWRNARDKCKPIVRRGGGTAIGRIIDAGKGTKEPSYPEHVNITLEGGWVNDGANQNPQEDIRFKFHMPHPVKHKVTIDYELLDRSKEAAWQSREGRDFFEEPTTQIVYEIGEWGDKYALARVTGSLPGSERPPLRAQSLYLKVGWTTHATVSPDRVLGVIYPVGWQNERQWETDPPVCTYENLACGQSTTDPNPVPVVPGPTPTPTPTPDPTPPPTPKPISPSDLWDTRSVYWGVEEVEVTEGGNWVGVPLKSNSDNGVHQDATIAVYLSPRIALEESIRQSQEPGGSTTDDLGLQEVRYQSDRNGTYNLPAKFSHHPYRHHLYYISMKKGQTEINFRVRAINDLFPEGDEAGQLCVADRHHVGLVGNLLHSGPECVDIVVKDNGEIGYTLNPVLLVNGEPLASGVNVSQYGYPAGWDVVEGDEPFTFAMRYEADRSLHTDATIDFRYIKWAGNAGPLVPSAGWGEYIQEGTPGHRGHWAGWQQTLTIPQGQTHADTPTITMQADTEWTDHQSGFDWQSYFQVTDIRGVNMVHWRKEPGRWNRQYTFDDPLSHTLRIIEDDVLSRVTGNVVENKTTEGKHAVIEFTRSGGSTNTLSIPYTVVPVDAIPGADYVVNVVDEANGYHGHLTFDANETTARVRVRLKQDLFKDGGEQFKVVLHPGGKAIVGQTEYLVTIRDGGVYAGNMSFSYGTPEQVNSGKMMRIPVYATLINPDNLDGDDGLVHFTHGWTRDWAKRDEEAHTSDRKVRPGKEFLMGYIFLSNQD